LLDPRYQIPLSGRYWQVTGPNGDILTSASSLGETIPEPDGRPGFLSKSDLTILEDETPVRRFFQRITLEDDSDWGITVAESLQALLTQQVQTRRSLVLAFVLVGLFGVVGAMFQIRLIMRPLEQLRKDVTQKWENDAALLADDYPDEVAPLVNEINELLERNQEVVGRARRQAADLAHALKTPSAILRNEVEGWSDRDLDVKNFRYALDRIDEQLKRSLARMRAANSDAVGTKRTELKKSIDRFAKLFGLMAERDGKSLEIVCEFDLTVRMDPQDFEEVIGNLLDNALKWCRSSVRLTTLGHDESVELRVEDDGTGIDEAGRRKALQSGARLDTSVPGTGLGLAIASDLLVAYGATLQLDESAELGGLAAIVTIPKARLGRSRLKQGA